MLDGKSLNLADLSAKLDEDDLANGKPKGDSVTYYRQMVDSLIESTSTRPEDRYIIFSQEGSQYFLVLLFLSTAKNLYYWTIQVNNIFKWKAVGCMLCWIQRIDRHREKSWYWGNCLYELVRIQVERRYSRRGISYYYSEKPIAYSLILQNYW